MRAWLAAAATCARPRSPRAASAERDGNAGERHVWSFGVAGFGFAAAYLTQGSEAVSFDDSESESECFSDDAEPRRSKVARAGRCSRPSEDDAWIKDDPFIEDQFLVNETPRKRYQASGPGSYEVRSTPHGQPFLSSHILDSS